MTEAQTQDNREIIRWIKRANVGILILAVVLVGIPAFASWWISRQLPVVNTVSVENMKIIGVTELCPGQQLVTEYDFHAQGEGVLIRDFTLWLITPPKTMVYSMSRRFILDGPTDQHLRETWTIPDFYFNYETELNEPLPPGKYRRYMAISSPSRSTVIAIASVEFIVKEDCPL